MQTAEMKLFFYVLFALFTVNSVFGQVCRTTCDFEPLSPSLSSSDVIRRGKSGPRGEKGETGLTGPNGSDQSEAVSKNSEDISRNGELISDISAVLSNHVNEIAKMSSTIVQQNETITQQNEVIKNLVGIVEEQAIKITDLSKLIEKASTTKEFSTTTEKAATITEEAATEKFSTITKEFATTTEVATTTEFSTTTTEVATTAEEVATTTEEEDLSCTLRAAIIIPINNYLSKNNASSDRVAHNTVVKFYCKLYYEHQGAVLRKCESGRFTPNFNSSPVECRRVYQLKWHQARQHCLDHGKDLIMDGISTEAERRKYCRRNKLTSSVWVGITKEGTGSWRFANGTELPSSFEIEWRRGYPRDNKNYDYMVMRCDHFGIMFNTPSRNYNLACQN